MADDDIRYGFGKNWAEFIDKNLNDSIVEASIDHLKKFMRVDSLAGLTFLDIGCGSGIHSLAALKLGAERVLSFDYDANSVATTEKVRAWSGILDRWEVRQGSVLDTAMMESLPKFDIVYSWGVLHHTGAMWDAVANAGIPLKPGGEFYIALYSSDNYVDPTPEEWIAIKKQYNQANVFGKKVMEIKYFYDTYIEPEIRAGRGWLNAVKNYGSRGMSVWTDAKDWLGGYPMEFSGLIETKAFVKGRLGLDLVTVLTGEGCSEYLFADLALNGRWAAIEASRERLPLPGPYQHNGGYGFQLRLDHLVDQSDGNEDPKRSRVMLYENGELFGFAHAVHQPIRELGAGRFSHWGEWLVFSTPDNTDPNENGRTYTYTANY
jgi:2-polyprenyl-3-methyl-5-hydroxy-6-metoxy-1,4-benzoquinol methylase